MSFILRHKIFCSSVIGDFYRFRFTPAMYSLFLDGFAKIFGQKGNLKNVEPAPEFALRKSSVDSTIQCYSLIFSFARKVILGWPTEIKFWSARVFKMSFYLLVAEITIKAYMIANMAITISRRTPNSLCQIFWEKYGKNSRYVPISKIPAPDPPNLKSVFTAIKGTTRIASIPMTPIKLIMLFSEMKLYFIDMTTLYTSKNGRWIFFHN